MPRIITEEMIEQAAINLLVTEFPQHYKRLDCFTPEAETLPDGTGRNTRG